MKQADHKNRIMTKTAGRIIAVCNFTWRKEGRNMGAARDSVNILCPFFIEDREVAISCEGFCDDTKSIRTFFKNVNLKKKHQNIFCKTHDFRKCEIYRMIKDAKYEEE